MEWYRKNNSSMFWGIFAGNERGPFVIWSAEWGKMTSEGYHWHIFPKFTVWLRSQGGNKSTCKFIKDNAPVQLATPAKEYVDPNGIEKLPWLAYSSNLNRRENIWSIMKQYIQDKC